MPRFAGYENVGHVLEQLARFHQQLSRRFQNLCESATDTRVTMLLRYLSEHQQKREAALRDYLKDAPTSLLENWFQIPFPSDPDAFLDSIDTDENLTVEGVTGLVFRCDAFLVDLLEYMEKRAETSNVKTLFQELITIDSREKTLRSRALASFEQI